MKKRILAFVLALVTVLSASGVVCKPETAQAAKAKNVIVLGENAATRYTLTPGTSATLRIPLKAEEGHYIYKPEFKVTASEGAPFEVGTATLFQVVGGKDYADNIGLTSAVDTFLQFSVSTKETAKIGKYQLRISCVDYDFGTVDSADEDTVLNDIILECIVSEEKLPAELAISSLSVSDTLEPGGTAKITFNVTNTGELEAKNVRLSADYSGGALLPDYTDYTKKLGDMKPRATQKVSLRVKVMESVKQQVVQLPLIITYKDNEGKEYTADENNILYLEVEIPGEEEFETGTLLVSNVRQSPSRPKAGEKVSLTFDMENTGERDYTDTKLYLDYVSGTGFEPVKAEPYQYVGTIKAGKKKAVTVNVIAGKDIAEGMNTLGIEYTYFDANKKEIPGSVTLYVLNVQKAEDTGLSKPKLMVSQFATSKDVIKAGEEFDFTFSVYNTHSETSAKNIKVTVTSEMFSVTKGSNSFFLPIVNPGESEEITINLKASAAATTGSYPVDIQMEYEYDGMPVKDGSDGSVEVTEKKMLLIKENLRVSVENVTVGGWQTPFVDQTTQLSFSIYNMGKSVLNNVFFTVEGDFAVANGSSYYYGTLQAGYPDYVEMDITPLVAGEAKGTLTVHMEDSNGDEVTYVSDISGMIMEMGGEPGWEDPGFDIPTDVFPMEEPQDEVKPIVSLPIFIAALVVVFLVSFFVTRSIRIASHKKKMRNEE